MCCMSNSSTHLTTWVSKETKQRFGALAAAFGLSESALLKRSVQLMLLSTDATAATCPSPPAKVPRDLRLYVRLRPADHVLLKERASARGMAPATYTAALVRSHLHAVTPLPDRELGELQRAVASLGLIGRNLNQIARAANQGVAPNGPTIADLRALLRALEGLRDHFKSLLKPNADSWQSGNAEPSR